MPGTIRQDDLLLRLIKDVNDIRSALRRTVANLPLYDVSNENTPIQITANENDYVPGNYDVLRLDSDAARTITGISGGVKGRFLRLMNVGSFEITISHLSALSLPANQVISATNRDIVINTDGQLLLYYDFTVSKWIAAWASGADRISVQVRRTAHQTITDSLWTPITWQTAPVDTGGFFSAGTPTYVTIPETGWYHVSATVLTSYSGSATEFRVAIIDNTNLNIIAMYKCDDTQSDSTIGRAIYLQKGHTISVYVLTVVTGGASRDVYYVEIGPAGTSIYTQLDIVRQ